MQMRDLIKPLDQLTDEELQERIREIRHSRTVTRPAAQKHKDKAVKVKAKKETSKVDSLLKKMSPEQIKQLLLDLGEG